MSITDDLGALYDKATGRDVIDTAGQSVAPPDTSANPRNADFQRDDDELSPDDAMDRTLGQAWDRSARREQDRLDRDPPRPMQWGMKPLDFYQGHAQGQRIEDAIRAEGEWNELPRDVRQGLHQLEIVKQTLEKQGLKVESVSDLEAGMKLMGLQKKSEGDERAAEPAADPDADRFFSTYAPDVKDRREAWKALNDRAAFYADAERQLEADPVKFTRDLIIGRGKHPLSLVSNHELIEFFVPMFGRFMTPEGLNAAMEYLASGVAVQQWEQELQQRAEPEQRALVELAEAFKASKPDIDDDLMDDIIGILENPPPSIAKAPTRYARLNKAYELAVKQLKKNPRKSKIDRDLEATAAKLYEAAA